MFIPVGTMNQAIMQVDKDDNGLVKTQELFNVMVRIYFCSIFCQIVLTLCLVQYVPLTDRMLTTVLEELLRNLGSYPVVLKALEDRMCFARLRRMSTYRMDCDDVADD